MFRRSRRIVHRLDKLDAYHRAFVDGLQRHRARLVAW